MYIPYSASLEDATHSSIIALSILGSNGESKIERWSSAIGIVTAICGNILISFALNTQRYAHIRLSKEREELEEKQRQKRKSDRKNLSYGTQQREAAESRAKANAKSDPGRYSQEDGAETDPLIPSMNGADSRKYSGSSERSRRGDDDESTIKEKSYLKSRLWWLGITMMTLGEAGNFLAYGFAPASIVSPLGVVAIIANCLIAPLLLHERFRWRDGAGVIVAVAGCVTIVMSASDSNPKLDPDTIWNLITRWEFLLYFCITSALILVLCWASNKYGDRSILIDIGLVGLFGGYTALSTKGVASLLSTSVWRVITFPITYLLVAILVGTAVMQIKYVNRALQRFNSTMVIPTQFVMFTISVIVGSAILYRDFERTTPQQAGEFVAGCALTFLGVWTITSGRGDESEGDDEELGEDEDAIDLVDGESSQPEIREREDGDDRRQSFIAGSSRTKSRGSGSNGTNAVAFAPSTPRQRATSMSESPSKQIPRGLSPAKVAAIRANEMVPIAQDASQPRPSAPPLHATTSDSVVPQTDRRLSLKPETPLRRGLSEAVSPTRDSPATPASTAYRSLADQQLDPQDARKLLNRRSSFLPGPLTSPLSSSLSAVVADSLRRGVDYPPTSSARRRSLKLRRRPTDDAKTRKRHSIASGEVNFEDEDANIDQRIAGAGSPSEGRVRSFSATLGEMSRTHRQQHEQQRSSDREV